MADDTPNPIIHRSKLFDGRFTAEELHAKIAWAGAKCSACGAPRPACRIQVFVALADMAPEHRRLAELGVATKDLKLVNWPPPNGRPSILWSRVFACALCKPAAMRAAAHAPSYAMVDIDNGPGPDRPLVGVPGAVA